jgi:hypothetical protein
MLAIKNEFTLNLSRLVRFKSRKINFQKKEKKSHEKKIVPVY